MVLFFSFLSSCFYNFIYVVLLLLLFVLFYFACPFKWNREIDLTNQNGGLPTSLMVNVPPNNNSLKDYSLQQIDNGDNRRLSINCTESVKQEEGGGKEGMRRCMNVRACVGKTFLCLIRSPICCKCYLKRMYSSF